MTRSLSLRGNLSWLVAWFFVFTAVASHAVEYLWRTVQVDFKLFALASLGGYLLGLAILVILWRRCRSVERPSA